MANKVTQKNILEILARMSKYALRPYPSARYGSVRFTSGGASSSSPKIHNYNALANGFFFFAQQQMQPQHLAICFQFTVFRSGCKSSIS